jgi:hypothetical protein
MKNYSFSTFRLLGVALLAVAAIGFSPGVAQATPAVVPTSASSMYTTATALRPAAILTTADVLSTHALPLDVKAVVYTISFTKGSLTSATIVPVGSRAPAWVVEANVASTTYYKLNSFSRSLTADEKYVIRVDRELFGAYGYAGICVTGVGTTTSSSATVDYTLER